jgi:hypothetical protein
MLALNGGIDCLWLSLIDRLSSVFVRYVHHFTLLGQKIFLLFNLSFQFCLLPLHLSRQCHYRYEGWRWINFHYFSTHICNIKSLVSLLSIKKTRCNIKSPSSFLLQPNHYLKSHLKFISFFDSVMT